MTLLSLTLLSLTLLSLTLFALAILLAALLAVLAILLGALLLHLLDLAAEPLQAPQFLFQTAVIAFARLGVGIERPSGRVEVLGQLLQGLCDGSFTRHHQLALALANIAR